MKKIGVAIFVLLAISSVIYFVFDRLGGNNPIEIDLVESPPPTLVGKTFEGQPQNEKLSEIFRSIETLSSLNPGTEIHTIYYKEPAGKLDTMQVFVGLDLPFALADLESKTFSETSYLLATISGSRWVMPGPDKVKEKLVEEATNLNLSLSGVFIDRIVSDREVQVIAPIK